MLDNHLDGPSEEASTDEDLIEETTEEEEDAHEQDVDTDDEETEEGEDEPEYFELNGKKYTPEDIDELEKGGLRQSDYTRKTQALSEKTKQVTGLISSLESTITATEQLISEDESGINWSQLAEDDPAEYLKKERELKSKKEALDKAKRQREQALNKMAADEAQKLDEAMAWRKPEDKTKDVELVRQYLASEGYTNEDIANIVDHRVYKAFIKAAKFDALKKSNPRKSKRAKTKLKPTGQAASKGKAAKPKSLGELFYG